MYKLLNIIICILITIACNNSSQSSKKTNSKSEKISENTAITTRKVTPKKGSTQNMVLIKGGKIKIGNNNSNMNCSPELDVNIKDFYLDKHPVTVSEFRQFIKSTGYKTDAERFGDSGVYDFNSMKWNLLKGAKWNLPLGPGKAKAEDNHPVTHVSWNDAVQYANWAGKRLPKESEWEYAARNGKNTTAKFSWGDKAIVNGKYKCNVWQGEFKASPEVKDGFLYTSPVGHFGETANGLTDMGGNVWNWCQNSFHNYATGAVASPRNKAIRGGSFMYDAHGEDSFSVYGRSQNSEETSLFNLGFRCAMDIK